MIPLEHAPRLVLGMPSTTPVADATVAFARASRRLRSSESAPFEIKDLTSALSQLEGHASDNLYFEYKVPADPSTQHLDPSREAQDSAAHQQLLLSTEHLLEWRWVEAKEAAKQVLRDTQSEDLRDEALNVIAAANALLGDLDAAIAALKQAVEGQWNFALQQNLGILALKVDPILAANQSTYWLDAAESLDDRERAIFLVLNMWSSSADDEGEIDLPERIRDSFRQALGSSLSDSTFAMLGLFLARHDSDWVSEPANWMSSPHFGTQPAALIMARAEGYEEFVDYLVEQSASQNPQVVQARDNFISQLVDAMFDEEAAMWAAGFAMNMVEQGLPCDSLNNALLRAMAVREICIYLRDNNGEPKDDFINWLVEVQQFAKQQTDEDLKAFITDILTSAATLYVLGFITARDAEIDRFAEALTTVHAFSQRWGSRRRLNKGEARRLALDVRSWALETQSTIDRLSDLPVTNDQVRAYLSDLTSRQSQIGRMANEILEKM